MANIFRNKQNWDPVSYQTIKNTLALWRQSGTTEETDILDTPGHLFFKIVFHFFNGDSSGPGTGYDGNPLQSGLLAPTWVDWINITQEGQVVTMEENIQQLRNAQIQGSGLTVDTLKPVSNSAYNFLIRNDEAERAEKLKQFILLLSNISSYSPWYFMEVDGLGDVLERPWDHNTEYKVEAPKTITIKCLPDAQDNRIATLLELYRDIVFSYTWHREILPANLRKFDMSIFIFDSMIKPLHFKKNGVAAKMQEPAAEMTPSYKRIELHDCEISYNATKSGYGSLSNSEGFQQTFEIPITVGDAYEYRYNPYIDRAIGDMVAIDLEMNSYSNGMINNIFLDASQSTDDARIRDLYNRLHTYDGGTIDILKIADDLTGNVVSDTVKSVLLGNIYKADLGDMMRNSKRLANALTNGNIGAAKAAVQGMSEVKNGWAVRDLGNITTGSASKAGNRTTIYNR